MLPPKYQWIAIEFEPEGDPYTLLQIAHSLEADGGREGAATVLDRAFGIDPDNDKVAAERRRVLDSLAVTEHGVVFRYVPAGTFLMGSLDGDADERPRHPVYLDAYWIAEVPTTLETYRRWEALVPVPEDDYSRYGGERLRYGYSEGGYRREGEPEGPRPAVAVGWHLAGELAAALASPGVRYALPSEARWEKAARGGRIGAKYPWGDDPPMGRADGDRFGDFSIRAVTAFPPNGYGLYAMSGGVWEWCLDWYQSDYYAEAPDAGPEGPAGGQERVLRGGCWADCADALAVSFRWSLPVRRESRWGAATPNIGFRLCRHSVG